MIRHSVDTWFKSIDIQDFYKTKFSTNLTNTIQIPYSILKRYFPNIAPNDPIILTKIYNAFFNIVITKIVSSSLTKNILPNIPFNFLEQDTIDNLRLAVCEEVSALSMNDAFIESVLSNSIQTPNFSIAQDNYKEVLKGSLLSTNAKNYIYQSGIKDYEWIDENTLYTYDGELNIKVIGSIDFDSIKKLEI